MAKDRRFGNSLADKLIDAWKSIEPASEGSKKSDRPLGSKQSSKTPPANVSAKQQKKPEVKKQQLSRWVYDASSKSIKTIREDYVAAIDNSRRRTIYQSVSAHYYHLQRKVTQDKLLRTFEIQELLKEMESGKLKNKPPVRIATHSIPKGQVPREGVTKPTNPFNAHRHFFTSLTQPPDCNSEDICDIVIGFDFGTACSKIVVRTPFYHDRAFIIPFGPFGHPSCQHLLPTHISLKDNCFYLPDSTETATKSDLKMRMISSLLKEEQQDAIDTTVAYFALAFRYVRTWFLKEQKGAYGTSRIEWHVNVGLPSATIEDDALCHLYEQSVATAWALSATEDDITVPNLVKTKEAFLLGQIREEDVPPIKVFPELAAEVAGYTNSDLRQEGLHLMLDIGAGTLDICGFNVVRINNENRLPLFSASVEPKGVKQLHHVRSRSVVESVDASLISLLPDAAKHLLPSDAYIPDVSTFSTKIQGAEDALFRECKEQLFRLAHHLKTSMDPRAQAWRSKFRVFICGGGSSIPFYRQLIDEFSEWLKKHCKSSQGAILLELPREEKVHGEVLPTEYHRFGVAIGLSRFAEDFDRVITNIRPITRPTTEPDPEPWFMKLENAHLLDC